MWGEWYPIFDSVPQPVSLFHSPLGDKIVTFKSSISKAEYSDLYN